VGSCQKYNKNRELTNKKNKLILKNVFNHLIKINLKISMDAIINALMITFWLVIVLVPIVVIHEFGHFLMSKLAGVKIPEFAVGFPLTKRLFYKKWRGTVWSFYPVLIGGFVRIWGDNDAIDIAEDNLKLGQSKEEVKEEYVQNRFQELLSSRDLQFFLEENHIEYTSEWKEFADSKYARGEEDAGEKAKIENFEKKYEQIVTLLKWELDKELGSKITFFSKNWFWQTLIISGGVLFNFIAAFIIFLSIFAIFGTAKLPTTIDTLDDLDGRVKILDQDENYKVSSVLEDTPAAEAGLSSGDEILEYDGVEIKILENSEELRKLVRANPEESVEIKYYSQDKEEVITTQIQPEKNEEDGKYYLGIGTLFKETSFRANGPGSAVSLSWQRLTFITNFGAKTLGEVFLALSPTTEDREALNYVGGPIRVGSESSLIFDNFGYRGILEVMASVSISLGLFNLLPIPALDGGRWVILTINKILGKRNRKIEAAVISATFVLMLILGVVVAINDVTGIN